MKRIEFVVLAVLLPGGLAGAAARAHWRAKSKLAARVQDDDANTFAARLWGIKRGSSGGNCGDGSFTATLSSDENTLSYTLTYNNLYAPVLFAHIHFGFPREATGIMVFLCSPADMSGYDLWDGDQQRDGRQCDWTQRSGNHTWH